MTIKARYYQTETTYEREACLHEPPSFLVGQRVRVDPVFGKPFAGEITAVHLRTVHWPRWQYTVTGGGTHNFCGSELEIHYDECELEAVNEDDGPCGDGNLEYKDLMKAVARRDASRIAATRAAECRQLVDDINSLLGDDRPDVQPLIDDLWSKVCELEDEARVISESLDYRTPEPPRKPNVFYASGASWIPIGHASEITMMTTTDKPEKSYEITLPLDDPALTAEPKKTSRNRKPVFGGRP